MNRWTLLLLLTLRWATGVAQPQVSVTHFDEFSGMAQWYVTQIVQDRSGMIWMATWNGLNRYDGYQFECFKSHPGDGCDMPSDRISNMMLNDEGNLWCLVEDRVFVFDVGTCRFSSLSAADEARAMKAFGLGDDYTARYEPPFSVVTDPYGTQWRIRSDGSLDYKDGEAADFRPYDRVLGQATNVYYCTSDREGNAWLRSKYGAYKLTFTKHPYTRLPQETAEQVRCLYLDNRRRYWVTTRDDASIRLFDADNRPLGYLGRDGRLHAAYTSFGSPVYCMLQTRDGAFWLGDVGVLPSCRGQKLGDLVLRLLLFKAQNHFAREVRLRTPPETEGFFARLGLKEAAREGGLVEMVIAGEEIDLDSCKACKKTDCPRRKD